MGATSFEHRIKAFSPTLGFKFLKEQAVYEHGNNPYSGTIANTNLRKVITISDKYNPESEKKAQKWIDENYNNVHKWDCFCLDLGVVEYISYSGNTQTLNPERPKMKYVVSTGKGDFAFDTLAQAHEAVKRFTSEGVDSVIYKNYGKVELERTSVKRVSHTRSISGSHALHMYVFYGVAPE